ncbi:predicted protein [Histoplasma capsulatum G186AR]|uniref:Uncharacterized protein n=1 Tax=Ajellomyces capsulatus (strain G186AR / H82 / ATCC MYA-2454 / RMSCC 2432) TaxID=447093 RepID=C0NRW2_AJECG|nr:uncharacterized protein HCBG_05892 [Histoplasma capsulatum G186AR]EEH05628.1 predicted protein [Histoplasma capsulatum G186AR]
MPFLTMHLWQNNVAGSTCGLDFNTNERGNEAWPGVQERGGCSMTSGTVLKEHPGAFLEPPSFSNCDKLTPNATLTWGDEVGKMGNNRKLSNVLHGARLRYAIRRKSQLLKDLIEGEHEYSPRTKG